MSSRADTKAARTRQPKAIIDNVPDRLTAHSIRRLVPCAGCTGIGDGQLMVRFSGQTWHTRCYRAHFGFKGVLALPLPQRGQFRLCDLTRREMQRLLASAAGRKGGLA